MQWFEIDNVQHTDTPALVIYKERMEQNILSALRAVPSNDLLRPHVKTNKIAEVCRMMLDKGIQKFKCSTIAEAEMLAMTGATDVLLAYQPVGPKTERLLQLTRKYPSATFSCLVDDLDVASQLSQCFLSNGASLNVFIDLNTGMKRTGISAGRVNQLIDHLLQLPAINITGLHAYDGHIKDHDLTARQAHSNEAYRFVEETLVYLQHKTGKTLTVVAGGSPTFLTHSGRHVECSPGTFVFWDKGYQQSFPDEPFELAALVITRIISIVDKFSFTTDLGYKSIASENPLPRVFFLNAPNATPVMHSEEHLVCKVDDSSGFNIGDVLYGVPIHICPTVALYDDANVVTGNNITETWQVIARKRKITI